LFSKSEGLIFHEKTCFSQREAGFLFNVQLNHHKPRRANTVFVLLFPRGKNGVPAYAYSGVAKTFGQGRQ
jgi:hypothetical protein